MREVGGVSVLIDQGRRLIFVCWGNLNWQGVRNMGWRKGIDGVLREEGRAFLPRTIISVGKAISMDSDILWSAIKAE